MMRQSSYQNKQIYDNFMQFKSQYKIYKITKIQMDSEISLPEPNIIGPNNNSAKLVFSSHLSSPGFTTKYDPEGQYIAIGCNGGQKILYSVAENKIAHQVSDPNEIPVTCIRWRPGKSKARVIGVCLADGHFEYYHIPTMKKVFSIQEHENSILCCDFDLTGQRFATSGKDCNIRVYDQNTKSVSSLLGRAEWNYSGHSNRVFSIKFIDENTLISGGWDSVIHVWDIRNSKSVKSFYGPHLAGDSLDFKDNKILTGCYASKNQIQLWDIRNFERLEALSWPCQKDEVAYVYSACFGRQGNNTIIAGASGVNEVRIFSGSGNKHETALKIFDIKQGCYSIDGAYKQPNICFVTAKQGFFVYNYTIN